MATRAFLDSEKKASLVVGRNLSYAAPSRDRRDILAVEVLAAFLGSEVAGDAGARQRHQQVTVHGIDLDDAVVSP
jgi:hypothetical protein